MAVNEGTYPADASTAVGLFRIEIGDDTPPVTPGSGETTAEYEFFGDIALQAFMDAYPDDRNTAMAKALGAMGRKLTIQAQDIQVDDIKIKTVERARLFMEHADRLLYGSEAADAATAFEIVPLSTNSSTRTPQGTRDPWPGVM
jgi:hypothetical protein